MLTVGDGNFSYSLAYLKKQQEELEAQAAAADNDPSSCALELTATSYDTYEELVDKYPESARICSQLETLGARVLHRVDATNLRVSVANALALKETSDSDSSTNETFDLVVFNHPHCGEENIRRHQSLLSHFYSSALDLLRVVDQADQIREGEIHLTLAEGQPERWEAVPRALRAGLRLVRRIDDVDNDAQLGGVEYDRKRHQNGKSFHRVLLHGEKLQQQSTLLIFSPATDKSDSAGSIEPTEAPKTTEKSLSRKRKAEASVVHEFACTACEKSFKTAQGLKTHVHMVHELGESDGKKKRVLLPCGVCDRTFKNEEAQQQHRLAKHGKHQLIQPDWFQSEQQAPESAVSTSTAPASESSTEPIANSTSELTCSICDMKFPSQDALQQHWQHLAPNSAVKLTCEDCDKSFDQMRALLQHQNFCKAKTSEAKAPSSPKASDTPVA